MTEKESARSGTAGDGRPTVAVLGTGRMGEPIAANLIRAGFPLRVWNRSVEKTARLVHAGAQLTRSPAEAATAADVVVTMLANGDVVSRVMTEDGALQAMRPGAVWIQMSTVGMVWTDRLAAVAADRGVSFVDAPVSGSDEPARQRQLVVLASGPEAARETVRPVFDAVGRKTVWFGPAGAGSAVKVVLNNWLSDLVESIAETLSLADALGVEPATVLNLLEGGPLDAPYARAKGAMMLSGAFQPGFALRLAVKDAGLALDAAHEHGVEAPFTEAVVRRWNDAVAGGHGDEDVAAAVTVAGLGADGQRATG